MAKTTFTGPVQSNNGFLGNVTGTVTGGAEGVITPAGYELAALPTNGDFANGTIIYVSDANSGVGTIAFNDGTDWIDIKTGLAVA
jgi:hypothetical protein